MDSVDYVDLPTSDKLSAMRADRKSEEIRTVRVLRVAVLLLRCSVTLFTHLAPGSLSLEPKCKYEPSWISAPLKARVRPHRDSHRHPFTALPSSGEEGLAGSGADMIDYLAAREFRLSGTGLRNVDYPGVEFECDHVVAQKTVV